eukprot:TRINITY_DN2164_c0_g1_i4.p1 TRINITY_DN2164_c0_g1~~TRINITY_DN2164_c0_g1_i4.p1  ORF type:complete len:660 (-),score=353.98 TRINITY_DN2164_c0_g1_i4:66-2045(-)
MGATTVPTVITVLGALLATAGIAAWFALSITFEVKVHAALTITSADDADYAKYVDSKHEDARPPKVAYTFFDVTNAAAVRNGSAAPVFNEVGPFVVTKHSKKLNVSFLDDGRQVSYLDRTYYEVIPSLMGTAADGTALTLDTKVTGFYPFYFGAIGALKALVPAGTNVTEATLEVAIRTAAVIQMYQVYDATYSGAITDPAARAGNTVARLLDASTTSLPTRIPITAIARDASAADIAVWADFLVGGSGGKALVSTNVPAAVTNTGAFLQILLGLATNCPNPAAAAACAQFDGAARASYPALGARSTSQIITLMGQYNTWSGFLRGAAWDAVFNKGNTGTGVLVTHTVREWLYDFTDPLLAQMLTLLGANPAAARVPLFANQTDAAAQALDEFYIFETGKNNKSAIGQYVQYEGKRTIEAYTPAKVVRGTNGVRNGMELSQADPLEVFVTQVQRPVLLSVDEDNTYDVKGITTFRYALASGESAVNAGNRVSVQGLFPIDHISSGIPIVLTKSRFLDSAMAGAYGIKAESETDDTIVYVEPFTGRTMRANLRLQINVAIPGSVLDGEQHGAMGRGAFFSAQAVTVVPLVTVDEFGLVEDEDASDFKDAVYGTRTVIIAVTAALCAIGGITMIVGGFLCSRAMKREASDVTPMTRMNEHP